MSDEKFKKSWVWKLCFALILIVIGAALLPNLLAFIFNVGVIVLLVILIAGFYFLWKIFSRRKGVEPDDD